MSEKGTHFLDARAPDGMRLYAIGDVHGRHDLLSELHGRILGEILRDQPPDWRIIHLGDLCDRGPETRAVIDFLQRSRMSDERIEVIAGNHDLGFLAFLENPSTDSLFVNYGGRETAMSYGVMADFSSPARLHESHLALLSAVPDRHLAFLRSLPLSLSYGDFFFCHAGIRPGVALDEQRPDDLVWIRQRFLHEQRLHPKVVVHGHTPVAEPEVLSNRVNLDTGAWQSGRLTAIAIEGAEKRLISAGEAEGAY